MPCGDARCCGPLTRVRNNPPVSTDWAPVLLDGTVGAIASSAIAVGIALVVVKRQSNADRDLFRTQRKLEAIGQLLPEIHAIRRALSIEWNPGDEGAQLGLADIQQQITLMLRPLLEIGHEPSLELVSAATHHFDDLNAKLIAFLASPMSPPAEGQPWPEVDVMRADLAAGLDDLHEAQAALMAASLMLTMDRRRHRRSGRWNWSQWPWSRPIVAAVPSPGLEAAPRSGTTDS